MAYSSNQWQWRPPTGATLDFNKGIQLNATITTSSGQSIVAVNSGIILSTTGAGFSSSVPWQMEIGYNATTGQQLWVQNRSISINDFSVGTMGAGTSSCLTDGVYVFYSRTTASYSGYSALTGEKLWGPTPSIPNAWASQSITLLTGYGLLFGAPVDGIHTYNLTTGEPLWDFYGDNTGVDFPGFANYPTEGNMQPLLADGKLYVATGDSHGDPSFRGMELYCVNATTGEKIWEINGAIQSTMAIADGVLIAYNSYDNQIYAFSKGQSATTVSAPTTAISQGTPVMIAGTVTDQSPGTTALGIPAAETPAISDDSMSAWMEYLYQQQPKPTNATGVPVHLTAIDPNGNFQDIGTTISNIDGTYAIDWAPPIPGLYHVTATFEGSNSYYSSSGATYFLVNSASSATVPTPSVISTATPISSQAPSQTALPSESPSQAPPPATDNMTTTLVAVAAAVIVVAIVAVAVILRRRK
jgi:outer membrane protein assembly factor BamB